MLAGYRDSGVLISSSIRAGEFRQETMTDSFQIPTHSRAFHAILCYTVLTSLQQGASIESSFAGGGLCCLYYERKEY
jgi:hypothetical protein